jgi:hypothetical protein
VRVSEITQVLLPGGEVIWARVSGQARPRDVGFGERTATLAAEEFSRLAGAVIGTVRDAVDGHQADEVTVDFGIELSAKSGKVVGVLAELGGTSSIAVHLTWKKKTTEATTASSAADAAESAPQPPDSPQVPQA